MGWPPEVQGNYTRERLRSELVLIAFKKVLSQRDLTPGAGVSPKNIAWIVTSLVDAQLAEMEKKPEAEPKND